MLSAAERYYRSPDRTDRAVTALQLVGAALSLVAGVSLQRSRRSVPGARDTPTARRLRLALGGRRFAYTGVGLAGLALLLPAGPTGGLRAGLLALALADMVLGLYLLRAGREAPPAEGGD